jgi:hypothetical protein
LIAVTTPPRPMTTNPNPIDRMPSVS